VGERDELPQRAVTLAETRVLLANLGDARAARVHAAHEVRDLLRDRGNLRLVAPAEHVACAVVERMPVVLLVAIAVRLDLSRARDRLALAAKLLEARAARVVEAARELALEPRVELRIRPDRDL